MVRTRSRRAHDDVVDAALRLFADRGIAETSMDAIAEASGVSKATIYNHWPDKEALCLEAMSRLHGLDATRPDFDSGDTRADLVAFLGFRPAPERSEMQARMTPHLLAYVASNRGFGHAWRERVMAPSRVELRGILTRGIARKELPADLDLDLAASLLIGPMMFRHIFRAVYTGLPDDLPECVADAFWRAHANPRRTRGRRA
jgi:AcrR family transcriptional regulator